MTRFSPPLEAALEEEKNRLVKCRFPPLNVGHYFHLIFSTIFSSEFAFFEREILHFLDLLSFCMARSARLLDIQESVMREVHYYPCVPISLPIPKKFQTSFVFE